jgi:hypothetical protein
MDVLLRGGGYRVKAAVRVLCQTGVPTPVQRVSEVASDRHRLAHARQRRGHDLRAVKLDDQDHDGARRIAAPDGGSAA